MIQLRRHPLRVALLALLLLAAAACSDTGGKQEEAPAAGANAGQANTPEITIQMVTHGAPGGRCTATTCAHSYSRLR